MEDKYCQAIKADGTRCKMYRLKDSLYCINHDKRPEIKEQKAIAVKAGGSVRHIQAKLTRVKVGRAKDIKKLMAKMINEVREGKVIDPRVVVAIKGCSDTFLKACEVADLEERLETLEKTQKGNPTEENT